MSEEKKKKYNRIAKITGVIIGLVLVLGVSYAVFRTTSKGEKTNRINTADFSVVIEDANATGITLQNTFPVRSIEGIKNDPYTFNVVNNGTVPAKYTLYLEADKNSDLPVNRIKYNLKRTDDGRIISASNSNDILNGVTVKTDENYEGEDLTEDEVNMLYGVQLLSKNAKTSDDDGNVLYAIDLGVIAPKTTYSYQFVMWLSYAASTDATGKSFSAKVRVDASQLASEDRYITHEFELKDDELGPYTKTFLCIYSDGTLGYEGNGALVAAMPDSQTEFIEALCLKDINDFLAEYGYGPYDSYESVSNALESLNLPEEAMNTLGEIINSKLSKIYIGGQIFMIGSEVFHGSEIKKVYIDQNVTLIGKHAFYNCPNAVITINNSENNLTLGSSPYGDALDVIYLK